MYTLVGDDNASAARLVVCASIPLACSAFIPRMWGSADKTVGQDIVYQEIHLHIIYGSLPHYTTQYLLVVPYEGCHVC